jgi:Cellulase (glycosyl hydrolase family 5)
VAGRETRRFEERKKEERERERAEERAEEERERRREEEREAEREEERRAEALARQQEFDAAEEKERRRQAAYRDRLRAERRSEAATAGRAQARLDQARDERRGQARAAAQAQERQEERREQARAAARWQAREEERREQARAAERERTREQRAAQERERERREQQAAAERERRRDAAQADKRAREDRERQVAAARERRRDEAQAVDRERERREESRDAQRQDRRDQARTHERDRERQEDVRAQAREGRRQEAGEDTARRERSDERQAEARRARTDERREEATRQSRAAAGGAAREQAPPTGELSGRLQWLSTRGRLVVADRRTVVTLRGVTLRGLERAEPVAGMFDPVAEEDELALLAEWGATAVVVPIAQDLTLDGAETADADDYLAAVDATVAAAAGAGLYTLLQLSLLHSGLPTHARDGSREFDPQVPDERSIDLWSLLALRYRDEPAVLFDLFRAPHDPEPDSADALDPVPWEVWRRFLLAMIGEVRRGHPRAFVVARGLRRGSDLSGFPLRYSDGSLVPNVLYGAELPEGDPAEALRALAPLAKAQPVGMLALRAGTLDVDGVPLLGDVLARAGYHWFADAWREPGAELVTRSHLRPTPLGRAFARALARPAAPDANLERPVDGGGADDAARGGEGGGIAGAFRLLARLIPGATPPATLKAPAAEKRTNFVFYGFSGAEPLPPFPDGRDADQSFALVARTLEASLKKLFPADETRVLQAWTTEKVLDALEHAGAPIREVHIASHGAATWISLAYHFNTRLFPRMQQINALPVSDHQRALEAMRAEDALVAGFLTNAIEPDRLARIRANHGPDASWQIWGCYAGESPTRFQGDPALPDWMNTYFERLNLGMARIDGIAVEIGKRLGVVCTAARDRPGEPERGLEFWHGTPAHTVERNTTTTPAKAPFWLWNVPGSVWVSYDVTGSELPTPRLLGSPRPQADLLPGKPPRWLTDLFWR